MIFTDSITGRVLWFKFITSETKLEYLEGLLFLLKRGFTILSVTIDGKRGIPAVFSSKTLGQQGIVCEPIPIQLCQFHVQKRISTLLTNHPQTDAGKQLKQINDNFIKNRLTEQQLGRTLGLYVRMNYNFLIERNEQGEYKHIRIIRALKTYHRSFKYLFTYQDYPNINIPNTTNHIDGGINTKIKELVRQHRGMSLGRRNKLIAILLNSLGDQKSN